MSEYFKKSFTIRAMGRSGGSAKRKLSAARSMTRAGAVVTINGAAREATAGGSPPQPPEPPVIDPFMGLSISDLKNIILNNPTINEMFEDTLETIPETFKDPLEEKMAKYILLETITMSGEPVEEVFGFDPLQEMREQLPREPEYAPQVVAWHCLREILPLLDDEGASNSEKFFKEILKKEYSEDLEKGIWEMSEENLDHSELLRICGFVTSLRVSRSDPVAQRIENLIEENIEDINKRSKVGGRVGQRPLVITFDAFSANYNFDNSRGASIRSFPGEDLQVIPARPENDPEKGSKDVKGVVIHEMIHGSQAGKFSFGTATMLVSEIPKDWDSETADRLLEGMTEGLTLVRCKDSATIKESIGVDLKKRHYVKEVAALYTILKEDCKVSAGDIPARLEELNNTKLEKVPALLEKWGCSQVFRRFSGLLKSSDPEIIDKVWLEAPIF